MLSRNSPEVVMYLVDGAYASSEEFVGKWRA